MRKKQDLTGVRKNMLLITEYSHKKGANHFWKFKCDCGKEGVTTPSHFNRPSFKSCGCYRKEIIKYASKFLTFKHRLPPGEAAFNWLYLDYKNGASKRNYEFYLNKKEFRKLVVSDCFYCGSKPLNKAKTHSSNGHFIYNGIDRIDSNKGYIKGNVNPCCKICNYAKRSMSLDLFKKWIKNAYEHLEGIK